MTGWASKFDLQLLCQCSSRCSCLCRSNPKILITCCLMLRNQAANLDKLTVFGVGQLLWPQMVSRPCGFFFHSVKICVASLYLRQALFSYLICLKMFVWRKKISSYLAFLQLCGVLQISDCLDHTSSPIDGITLSEAMHARWVSVPSWGCWDWNFLFTIGSNSWCRVCVSMKLLKPVQASLAQWLGVVPWKQEI